MHRLTKPVPIILPMDRAFRLAQSAAATRNGRFHILALAPPGTQPPRQGEVEASRRRVLELPCPSPCNARNARRRPAASAQARPGAVPRAGPPRGRGPDHRLRSLRPFVVEMASLRGYRLGKKNGPTGSSRRAELANPVSQLVRANRPREPLIRRSAKEGNGAASCYHATAQHAKK